MNIWNLRAAIIVWIFAWGWLQVFDLHAPTRERWSVEHREARVLSAQRAVAQAESDAQDAAEFAVMCADPVRRIEEICNPPEEPSLFCRIFNCEDELSEAQEIADSID